MVLSDDIDIQPVTSTEMDAFQPLFPLYRMTALHRAS